MWSSSFHIQISCRIPWPFKMGQNESDRLTGTFTIQYAHSFELAVRFVFTTLSPWAVYREYDRERNTKFWLPAERSLQFYDTHGQCMVCVWVLSPTTMYDILGRERVTICKCAYSLLHTEKIYNDADRKWEKFKTVILFISDGVQSTRLFIQFRFYIQHNYEWLLCSVLSVTIYW